MLLISVLNRKYCIRNLIPIGLGFLLAQILFLTGTGGLPTMFWLPCMAVAVGLMFLFLVVCCRDSVVTLAYYCAGVFLLAEFAASLEWQFHCYLTTHGNW